MGELEHRSISDRVHSLSDSVDDPEQSEELQWIALEIRELERQLAETTTIRRMDEALSSSLESLLTETFSEIENGRLHKRELAWFLYVDAPESGQSLGPENQALITITIGASSLRLRCGKDRSELDLHELDNFVLKGHQEPVRDMINEALTSVCSSIEPLVPTGD